MRHISRLEGQATGVALIGVGENGENQIIVAPGANDALSVQLIPQASLSADAVICQLEIPIPTIEAIAKLVTGFFAINLAPAAPIARDVLERADLIIVNETEAAFYGDALSGLYGLVVVTLGAKGARMHLPDGNIITAAPPLVTPLDTTGQGIHSSAPLLWHC
ncbi:MAG: hypothetical protein HC777_00160 [Hyphomonadaceae bacterium]|nr:hypothetical protein [Hyphomonadaceae bacterium]